MKKTDLYRILKDEGIYYKNAELSDSRGAIISFEGITAIVVDDTKIDSVTAENTVIIQELGHYFSDNYYRYDSSLELVETLEYKSDICAWLKFFPYEEVKFLRKNGLYSATSIASYYDVEVSYISKCLNFYYNNSNGFKDDELFVYDKDK